MGHTRMTTQGSARFNANNHPFAAKAGDTTFALAHNPTCIYRFEKLGVHIYASTEPILKSALKQLNMKLGKPAKIKVDCGEILKIDAEGRIKRSQFDDGNIIMGYSHWPRWCNVIPEVWEPANDPRDDYINDLKSVAELEREYVLQRQREGIAVAAEAK